jgi:hypothetical protein
MRQIAPDLDTLARVKPTIDETSAIEVYLGSNSEVTLRHRHVRWSLGGRHRLMSPLGPFRASSRNRGAYQFSKMDCFHLLTS